MGPSFDRELISGAIKLYYQRAAGLALAAIPVLILLEALPREAQGPIKSIPGMIAFGLLAATAGALLFASRPSITVLRWALWPLFGLGAVLALASLSSCAQI